jgi:glycosyltransferase involved in cell wall biosynthesis
VLDEWPVATAVERHRATTVGHWRSYGSITRDGVHYGQKAHSLRTLIDLPRRAPGRLELALAIHPDETRDLKSLSENGWDLLDPGEVAATPDDYRHFVQGSWAEFGLAKLGYVVAGSGWFSDRSACYLASGRPVLAQDTGFGRRLPVGAGLLAFSNVDDVVAGIEELERDYDRHRAAARQIAEEHLAADRVLGSLLERLLP